MHLESIYSRRPSLETRCHVHSRDRLSCLHQTPFVVSICLDVYLMLQRPIVVFILKIRCHVYLFQRSVSMSIQRPLSMSIFQNRCHVYFTGALSCLFYRRVVMSILQTRCHVCSRDPLPFLFQRPVDTCCVAASRKRRTRSP